MNPSATPPPDSLETALSQARLLALSDPHEQRMQTLLQDPGTPAPPWRIIGLSSAGLLCLAAALFLLFAILPTKHPVRQNQPSPHAGPSLIAATPPMLAPGLRVEDLQGSTPIPRSSSGVARRPVTRNLAAAQASEPTYLARIAQIQRLQQEHLHSLQAQDTP